MGKVSISEPIKGESLTATKLNSTIASWTTESTNINAENVHDQALDNYNFAEESVRAVKGSRISSDHYFDHNNQEFPIKKSMLLFSSNVPLDFVNEDHILRASFHIQIYPNFNTPVFADNESFEVILYVGASFVHPALRGLAKILITERKLKYDTTQCVRTFIDESITIATHLNSFSMFSGIAAVNDLELRTKVEFNFTTPSKMGNGFRAGIYGVFAEIETIKR